MKRSIYYFTTLTAAIVMVSCGSEAPPPMDFGETFIPEIEEPEFTAIEWDGLRDTSIGNDFISIEGYIGPLTDMFYMGGDMSFDLFPRRNQTAGLMVDVSSGTSDLPNSIQELPENFSSSSLRVVCDDSTIAFSGDYVRVSGKVDHVDSTRISIQLYKVEILESNFSETVFESAIELTQAIVSDTTQTNIYSFMDGKLALPDMFLSNNGRVKLDFRQSNNKEVKGVYVMLSKEASSMDSPPDYYSSDDLVYRDCNGATLGASNKVRVYGTWTRSTVSDGGDFSVEEIVKL